jgi:hypothetical protein
MKKQKIYSRWQFEPKDYRVVRHEEVTVEQKHEAADIFSSIVADIETPQKSEIAPPPRNMHVNITRSIARRVTGVFPNYITRTACGNSRRFSKSKSQVRLRTRRGYRRQACVIS